jgi:hypothetical protein
MAMTMTATMLMLLLVVVVMVMVVMVLPMVQIAAWLSTRRRWMRTPLASIALWRLFRTWARTSTLVTMFVMHYAMENGVSNIVLVIFLLCFANSDFFFRSISVPALAALFNDRKVAACDDLPIGHGYVYLLQRIDVADQ